MFRRGLGLSSLSCLTLLLISLGIDAHAVFTAKPAPHFGLPLKPGFVPIGPRRYPPAYHAAVFAVRDNPCCGRASHQTVIRN